MFTDGPIIARVLFPLSVDFSRSTAEYDPILISGLYPISEFIQVAKSTPECQCLCLVPASDPNYQPGHHDGQIPPRSSSRRRHHASGSNPGSYVNSTFDTDAASTNDEEFMQSDPRRRNSQGTSHTYHPPPSSFSMYSQSLNDPAIYLHDYSHPRTERLDDIDDSESHLDQQSELNIGSYSIDDRYGQNFGEEEEEDGGRDDTSFMQEPTPLPKIPLFVLSIVIFSEPLTSTILFPFVYFMIVGPVLGGYLANPAKNFPEIFGNWQFFIEYPYFLPCFVAAVGSVVGFIVGYFFLEETKGKRNFDNGDDTLEENLYSASHYDENDDYRSLKTPGMTSRPTSRADVRDEQQPLMVPQPHQVKFANRGDMGHSAQYGSTMTLTHDAAENQMSSSHISSMYCPTSARSTIARRPAPARPSIMHQRASSASGEVPLLHSYAGRRMSVEHNPHHLSHRKSSGGLSYQASLSIPPDATSLSFYGYTQEPFSDAHGRGVQESGRRSRMSAAPSQVYILPPDPNNKDPNQPMKLIVVQSEAGLSPLSITTIVAYAMLALHSIVFEEVYTLYAVTPLKSHGLGWNAIQLSTSLACMGVVQLVVQFVVYPKMERRFSAVWLFRCAQLLYAFVYIAFPLIRAFAVDESDEETGGQIPRVQYMVLTGLVFKYFCSVFSYTSVMVMITNSSPPHLLGTVNGIGQTSASFMRAFGPALGGILWAWSLSNRLSFPFNYFFVFFLMGTIAILGFIHSLSIPRDLGVKRF
ncbi:hypothetical protein BGZ80_003987 [Entomortierella chlamydospora]|uniref:Major facilitator superfamily transporter n=1 Tax=Entomortierella chlamydospora TaxID=101097 RepID=A0A9P6T372_9FUNG|nr:hypothetical protein BGZ80_003987 [Entomortierella chlamydospora]